MLYRLARRVAVLAGATLLPAVHAQSPSPVQRADPLDPRAEVPRLVHRSSLAAYRAANDLEVGAWKRANDNVARIGGWRAYAREASAPEPAPPANADGARPAPPAAAPAAPAAPSGGHGGHGKH